MIFGKQKDKNKLLSSTEVKEMLQISDRQLERLRDTKQLAFTKKPTKNGGCVFKYFYKLIDVKKYRKNTEAKKYEEDIKKSKLNIYSYEQVKDWRRTPVPTLRKILREGSITIS